MGSPQVNNSSVIASEELEVAPSLKLQQLQEALNIDDELQLQALHRNLDELEMSIERTPTGGVVLDGVDPTEWAGGHIALGGVTLETIGSAKPGGYNEQIHTLEGTYDDNQGRFQLIYDPINKSITLEGEDVESLVPELVGGMLMNSKYGDYEPPVDTSMDKGTVDVSQLIETQNIGQLQQIPELSGLSATAIQDALSKGATTPEEIVTLSSQEIKEG